jgi:hypothetical protein
MPTEAYALCPVVPHMRARKAIYYCPLKMNRLVDDSEGKENYKSVESLSWTRLRTNLKKSY